MSGAPLNRAQIAGLIPHAGAMCLLQAVEHWSAARIGCVATSHRDPHNPLRRGALLPALAGLEYGAQAMAVHGALTGAVARRPRMGVIASVRALEWTRDRLDDIADDLVVEAERLAGEDAQVLYAIAVRARGAVLLRGRIAALLQAELS